MGLYEVNITADDYTRVFGPQPFPIHYHPADWIDDIERLDTGAKATLAKAEANEDADKTDRMRAIINRTTSTHRENSEH